MLCTGRTAHRESRGLALLFHDHGTRRGWGVSVTPRPLFTPWKDPVPIVQEAGWAPGPVWTGAKNLAPTGIRSPDRPVHSQLLCGLRYRPTIFCNIIEFCFKDEPFFFWQNPLDIICTSLSLRFSEVKNKLSDRLTYATSPFTNLPLYLMLFVREITHSWYFSLFHFHFQFSCVSQHSFIVPWDTCGLVYVIVCM